MTPIFSNDEDTPDKDRLEALKAMCATDGNTTLPDREEANLE
jgi:hypothetical protein